MSNFMGAIVRQNKLERFYDKHEDKINKLMAEETPIIIISGGVIQDYNFYDKKVFVIDCDEMAEYCNDDESFEKGTYFL